MTVPHQQEKILTLLQENANIRGWVSMTPQTISARTGVPHHDVVKALWGMQKRELISFKEDKSAGRSRSADLKNLRMTRKGLKYMLGDGDDLASDSEVLFPESESIPVQPAPEGLWDEPVTPPLHDESTPPVTANNAIPLNGGHELASASPLRSHIESELPMTHTVLMRAVHLRDAIKALEAAGLDDLALQAAVSEDTYTDLERELVKLVEWLEAENQG